MKKLELNNLRRKPLNLHPQELITTTNLSNSDTLPLVIKPNTEHIDLINWLENNQEYITNSLLKYGAILFRGFNIDTPSAFEKFGLAVCSELFNENGEHPRETVSGKVYTPVFYPADRKLLWHNENSFNYHFPLKIMFGCRQPAQQGGETPIVDSRQVFQSIPTKIKQHFLEKQIMYVRNYGDGLGLDWPTVFQTENPAEVEKYCQKNSIHFEWKPGGRLRTRSIRPAVIKHPQTEELSWFNQAQHWHPACLDPITRETLMASFSPADLPRNCYYGDGSIIEDGIMQEICQVYQQLEIVFPWLKGDVLLLDNILAAHARNSFTGERKLLVAMGEMTSYTEIGY
ncbi:MAG TPA: TauD/TfdA family dioxygenase [Nostocaceae cyanobacterium]|nr:TauD/TfdA family dioxygenase [Nostocaceae cyanobacterium]